MNTRRLKCLYGVKDDLHDFTERAINTLTLADMNAPCGWAADYGAVQCGILHRDRQFQIEMVIVRPGVVIPPHTHPGTDSIEYAISGGLRLHIGGEKPFDHLDDDRFLSFIEGKGVRIASDAAHGGVAHPLLGAVFLSFQRWTGSQGHIGDNYVGAGVSSRHDVRIAAAGST